jgi:hypothetical protein
MQPLNTPHGGPDVERDATSGRWRRAGRESRGDLMALRGSCRLIRPCGRSARSSGW